MRAIAKRAFKNYMKNPLLWIGLLVMVFGIYQSLSPYLQLHYFQSEKEIASLSAGDAKEADVMEGYVPSTEKQQMASWTRVVKKTLTEEMGVENSRAAMAAEQILEKKMTVGAASRYLEEEFGFVGAQFSFYRDNVQFHQGSKEEVNDYIAAKMEEHPFSYYFSRKFADFCGLYMGFFASILLAFLFLWDTKKGTYELLHTKPIKAGHYVCGKVCGGFSAIMTVLVILNLIFGILCRVYGEKAGFPTEVWDLPKATLLYIVPNMLMIISVHTVISLLFKNPLPTIPLLLFYLVYSNLGSENAEGVFGYYGRPLSVLVRFPGKLLETAPPPMVLLNQAFLVAASVALVVLAVSIWGRRRVH